MLLVVFVAFHGLVVLYKWVDPPLTNMMLVYRYQFGNKAPLVNLRSTWIPLEQISPYLLRAVLIGEDRDFFHHHGFYLTSMWNAYVDTVHHKKPRGSSTITQQTVKNLFLSAHQTYARKAIELYFALLLELVWGKDRIFEVYLNIMELAKGVYGVERGCQHHFAKSASRVSFDESCLLAGILSTPRIFNPRHPNTEVLYKASYVFRQGLSAAKEENTDIPLLSGKVRFF